MQINIGDITPSPHNPRRIAEGDPSIEGLAQSIEAHGIMHPVVVRKLKAGGYELLAGRRRFEAVKLLEHPTITATVVEADDQKALELITTENLQREQLAVMEEARSVASLFKSGKKPEDIAYTLGKTVSWVMRRSQLTKLIGDIADAINVGVPEGKAFDWRKVPVATLEAVARLKEKEQQGIFKRIKPYHNAANVAECAKNAMQNLAEAPFMSCKKCKDKCASCTNRTDANANLFDDVDGANCLDADCYAEQMSEYISSVAGKVAKAHKLEKVPVILSFGMDKGILPGNCEEVENRWGYSECEEGEKGGTPMLKFGDDGKPSVVWMKKDASTQDEMTEEQRKAAKEEAERKRKIRKAFAIVAMARIHEFLHGDLEGDNGAKILAMAIQFGVEGHTANGIDLYSLEVAINGYADKHGKFGADVFGFLANGLIGAIDPCSLESKWSEVIEETADELKTILAFIGIDGKSVSKRAEEIYDSPKELKKELAIFGQYDDDDDDESVESDDECDDEDDEEGDDEQS